MKRHFGLVSLAAILTSGYISTACAAPLDDLLTADTPMRLGAGNAEISYDAMNGTLDVFHIRANDAQYAGTNVGDYSGAHIKGGINLTNRLWLDGGFWHRSIKYNTDTESLDTWQIGLQYLLAGNSHSDQLYAVRVSAWGDRAGTLSKSTPTTVSGQQLDYIDVKNPNDTQFQADLLGSWKLNQAWMLSGLVGGGYSKVNVGDITAGYNGCAYAINVQNNATTGNQIGACGPIVSSSFSVPSTINLHDGLSYSANYAHLGLNLQWHYRKWTLKGGYLFEVVDRKNVDSIISTLGRTSYRQNNIFDGELAYQVLPQADLFVRGEIMTNQFVGEIPFTYNAVTSNKFSERYGIVSFGARTNF